MINISWSCRSKIKALINAEFIDENLSTIFLFDGAFNEIYSAIISDSFLRFKMSTVFKNFLKNGQLTKENVGHHMGGNDSVNSFNQSYSDIHLSLQNYERPKTNNLALELTLDMIIKVQTIYIKIYEIILNDIQLNHYLL